MQNIASLRKEGTSAEHQSLIPPFTVPAWTSLSTGVNPGKHGAYSFLMPKDDYTSKVSSSQDVDYPRIYELCALKDLNSIVINLPLSYPPIHLKGVMISDWLYPKHEVYPKKEENLVKDYVPVNPVWVSPNPQEYVRKMQKGLETRLRVIKNLFSQKEWSLFFVVFSELDFLFHKFYREIFSGDEGAKKTNEIFVLLDNFIGWVRNNISRETLLLLVSDHGFTEYKRVIHVNMLLNNVGLAKAKTILKFLYEHPILYNTIRKTLFTVLGRNAITRIGRENSSAFDVKSSVALMHSHTHSGIYLNSKDIFQKALLNDVEIEQTIKTITNCLTAETYNTGKKIVERIYTREELFHGPHVKKFPHIIFFPNKENWFDSIAGQKSIEEKSHIGHSPGGLFISYGEDVKRGVNLKPISIYDIVPTILHYLGLPIPHDTDGRVLFEILKNNSPVKQKTLRRKNYLLKWKLLRRTKFTISQ